MTKCSVCGNKWRLKEVWAVGWSKKGRACSNCGHRQYISGQTKGIFTLGYLSLLFVLFFPFIIKLSDKDEELI